LLEGKYLRNKTNIAGALITVVLPGIFGFMEKPTEMGIAVVACAIALSFLNLDKIQRFKGAGFEAEMKKAVDEANATVKQLRIVALTSVEAALTTLMSSSFLGGTNLDTKIKLHDQLINSLKEIGISDVDINKSCERWHRGVGLIFHRGIRKSIEKDKFSSEAEYKKVISEYNNIPSFHSDWSGPSSEELRDFINEKAHMGPETEELLKDYEHYEKTKTFRRRNIFVNL
tara:strand:- start:1006 stop:1692 length:687 start_codon:yes stop_codon:yes gene_type:complete